MFASMDWLSPYTYTGVSTGMPIIHSLYLSPLKYSQHCFITMNSALKDNASASYSTNFPNTQFRQTRNPVLDLLVTVSDTWSALTLALMVNPIPCGSGILRGSSSSPSTCPNSLEVQSLHSNCMGLISGK